MLKDYIKAAKEQQRFFKVPVEEVAEAACELVHARLALRAWRRLQAVGAARPLPWQAGAKDAQ